jgi:hypothetical protein
MSDARTDRAASNGGLSIQGLARNLTRRHGEEAEGRGLSSEAHEKALVLGGSMSGFFFYVGGEDDAPAEGLEEALQGDSILTESEAEELTARGFTLTEGNGRFEVGIDLGNEKSAPVLVGTRKDGGISFSMPGDPDFASQPCSIDHAADIVMEAATEERAQSLREEAYARGAKGVSEPVELFDEVLRGITARSRRRNRL